MSTVTIPYRYGVRGGTAANLATVNEVPMVRELVYETDTGFYKIGNGSTAYNSLPYAGIYPAGDIPITDAGGYFSSTDVEGALQELGGGAGGGLNPSTDSYRLWELDNGFLSSTATGTSFNTTAGIPVVYYSGTAPSALYDSGRPGAITLTAAAVGSYNRLFFTPPMYKLGGGAQRYNISFRINTLPTGTQDFLVQLGLGNIINGGGGRYLIARCSNATNSGNWYFSGIDSGGTTDTNSAIAPVAGAWTTVGIEVNAAGTSAEFFVDGVSAGTVSANLPTDALALNIQISKTVGSTARTMDVDFGDRTQTFTTPR